MTGWKGVLLVESAFKAAVIPSLACMILQTYFAIRDAAGVEDIFDALTSHPAVSSLGCDFIISGLSYLVWSVRGYIGLTGVTKDAKSS